MRQHRPTFATIAVTNVVDDVLVVVVLVVTRNWSMSNPFTTTTIAHEGSIVIASNL
jgi:hypothetical protein